MEKQITANNEKAKRWNSQEETWMAHAASLHVPLDGSFELTARCNLSCRMCYVRLQKKQIDGKGRELSAKEWIDLGRQAQEAGTLYLLITGGEPLLHPEFEEIYTELSKMGFIITLYTNATLIDDNIQALLKKYPPMHTSVTVYGAGRETYEKVCGRADGFDRTISGLERLKEVSTKLEIKTTYIKDNAADMEEIYRIASRYTNVYKINPEVHKPFLGVDSEAEAVRLTPREAVEFDERYYRFLLKEQEQYQEHENIIVDNREKRTGFELEPVILDCLAAKSSYSINWEGKMLACNTFSEPYTEPLKEGFQKAWERLPHLLMDIKKPQKCLECGLNKDRACPNCPPKLFIETGSFEKTSSYICEYAKEKRKKRMEKEMML